MRYGIVTAWAEYFEKHESVQVSDITIRNRLAKKEIIGRKTRYRVNRVVVNPGLFSEAEVRRACADLLSCLPWADKDGFFELDGVKYGTVCSWSRILPISESSVALRMKEAGIEGVKGKIRGHVRLFYSQHDVRSACADLLQPLLQADESGFFEKDGNRYGTLSALGKVLDINSRTIQLKLESTAIKPVKGKDSQGKIGNFYSEK